MNLDNNFYASQILFKAIANHLHDLMNDEKTDTFTVIHQVKDDSRKKELRLEDDEEDFLDEGILFETH